MTFPHSSLPATKPLGIPTADQRKKPRSLSEKQGLIDQCTAPPLLLLLLDSNDSIPGSTSLLFCQGLQLIRAPTIILLPQTRLRSRLPPTSRLRRDKSARQAHTDPPSPKASAFAEATARQAGEAGRHRQCLTEEIYVVATDPLLKLKAESNLCATEKGSSLLLTHSPPFHFGKLSVYDNLHLPPSQPQVLKHTSPPWK
jgi:hypothetical protein